VDARRHDGRAHPRRVDRASVGARSPGLVADR
jgi:hypothetical protein